MLSASRPIEVALGANTEGERGRRGVLQSEVFSRLALQLGGVESLYPMGGERHGGKVRPQIKTFLQSLKFATGHQQV